MMEDDRAKNNGWKALGTGIVLAGAFGGGERWATVCSLIATAKLNDVEPYAYLRDVLERMVEGYPMSRLDDLLPWNWSPSSVNP